MAAETPNIPQQRLGVPSRNPLPLSASQESQVRDIYYARVRKQCADEIKGRRIHCFLYLVALEERMKPSWEWHDPPHFSRPIASNPPSELSQNPFAKRSQTAFADCALGRTFSVTFACRAEHTAMNACMKLRATQEEQDAAREEWFALRMERQRQRERKTKMAAAQEEFMREWWGLPEDVRLSRQKEMEKRGETVPPLRPDGSTK
ncbi:hypothetical protein TrVFT333_002935 [Trichoderma virens FT-333]|nr:hypothetical protein TrVFT333_002935 [Trichoderma virens FT-333]